MTGTSSLRVAIGGSLGAGASSARRWNAAFALLPRRRRACPCCSMSAAAPAPCWSNSRSSDTFKALNERAAAEYARQRGFADVSVAGSPPLPFETGSFDLVTILDVLEHIQDDVAMLAEIRRLLRPGGRMVATVPAFPGLWGRQDEISHHKRRYVRSTLTESVERSGLRLERLTYFNTALFAPIATVRLLRRLRPNHGEPSSDFEMTTTGIINDALGRVFSLEASWLASRNLPFGVSLMAVAERPPDDET